jgi:hypothetical protein
MGSLRYLAVLVVVFFVAWIVFGAALYSAVCSDGWKSPSIGSSGACSHHGGVDQSWKYYSLLLAGGATFLTHRFIDWVASRWRRVTGGDPAVVRQVTPYGSLEMHREILCRSGASAEKAGEILRHFKEPN